jgi:hypothetical protein
MPKKKSHKSRVSSDSIIRQCANIRSRKHPDAKCPFTATDGDFCIRHSKNPVRFQEKLKQVSSNLFLKQNSANKIQRWWKLYSGILRYRQQGPAVNIPADAENQVDIYTLDPTSSIPVLYRWSYIDSKKHLWLFDIRSLSMTRTHDSDDILTNPYTRETIIGKSSTHFQERCKWLRDHKYCLLHTSDIELTPEQLWHQKILDVTMKYDVLGYHTCLNWFEELSISQLYHFYRELWELWHFRLQLSNPVKLLVVPRWNTAVNPLFKWSPLDLMFRNDKRWWQKVILELMDRLVSSAQTKEHKILGALYGMTAFAIVSWRVRQYYTWLVEMPNEEDNDDI